MNDNSPRRIYPRQTSNGTDANGCLICNTNINCSCAWNESCVVKTRDCLTCPTALCVPNNNTAGASTSPTQPKGINKGAIAAAVVVPLVVFALAVLAFFWYHRRRARRLQAKPDAKPDPSLCSTITEERTSQKWHVPHLPIANFYTSSSNGATKADTDTAYGQAQPAVRATNPFTDKYNW